MIFIIKSPLRKQNSSFEIILYLQKNCKKQYRELSFFMCEHLKKTIEQLSKSKYQSWFHPINLQNLFRNFSLQYTVVQVLTNSQIRVSTATVAYRTAPAQVNLILPLNAQPAPLTPGNHRSLFSPSRFALPLWDCEVIHMEDSFNLWESSKLFSKVVVPPCVTSNHVRHYLFPKYKITLLQYIFHGTSATSHWQKLTPLQNTSLYHSGSPPCVGLRV